MNLSILVDSNRDQELDEELVRRLIISIRERGVSAKIERIANTNLEKSKSANEIIGWGQIALTLMGSGGVLVSLIAILKEWISRQPPETKIRLKLGNEEIEINGKMGPEELKIVADFMKKYKET